VTKNSTRPANHGLRNSIRREFRSFDSRVLGGLIERVCGTARLGPESEFRMLATGLACLRGRSTCVSGGLDRLRGRSTCIATGLDRLRGRSYPIATGLDRLRGRSTCVSGGLDRLRGRSTCIATGLARLRWGSTHLFSGTWAILQRRRRKAATQKGHVSGTGTGTGLWPGHV
jgi:hypothetical protein